MTNPVNRRTRTYYNKFASIRDRFEELQKRSGGIFVKFLPAPGRFGKGEDVPTAKAYKASQKEKGNTPPVKKQKVHEAPSPMANTFTPPLQQEGVVNPFAMMAPVFDMMREMASIFSTFAHGK
jgi:hypothetical protein